MLNILGCLFLNTRTSRIVTVRCKVFHVLKQLSCGYRYQLCMWSTIDIWPSFLFIQAASTLKILSSQISQKNLKKEPVTDGEINAFEHSLQTVLSSFKSLAEFKAQHKDKVPRLDGLPIDDKIVASMQVEMP